MLRNTGDIIDEKETISNLEAASNLWKHTRWIMLSALMHPIYSVVNAIAIGHQSNEKMLAGLRLGYITVSVCALSVGTAFNRAIATFVSHAYG